MASFSLSFPAALGTDLSDGEAGVVSEVDDSDGSDCSGTELKRPVESPSYLSALGEGGGICSLGTRFSCTVVPFLGVGSCGKSRGGVVPFGSFGELFSCGAMGAGGTRGAKPSRRRRASRASSRCTKLCPTNRPKEDTEASTGASDIAALVRVDLGELGRSGSTGAGADVHADAAPDAGTAAERVRTVLGDVSGLRSVALDVAPTTRERTAGSLEGERQDEAEKRKDKLRQSASAKVATK